jgi:GxxExxY protein
MGGLIVELIYKEEVYASIGTAMNGYNTLGPGFAEPVYQEAFWIEMVDRQIPVKAQQELIILYKGKPLQKTCSADFIAYNKIIIEIKALDQLGSREEAQLLNYLKATSSHLGLLVNFGSLNDLKWKRMVATDYRLKFNRYSNTIREEWRGLVDKVILWNTLRQN